MTSFHLFQFAGFFACVCAAWLVPRRWQLDAVSLLTMLLLALLSPASLILLSLSGCIVFLGAKNIGRSGQGLKVSLIVAYCLIQYLLVSVIKEYGEGIWSTVSILGLAYYTCRHVHYVFDCYSGKIRADMRRFWHYQFYWPVMVTGPIHRYQNFIRESDRRRWDADQFSLGLHRIVFGYFKVVFIGNYLLIDRLPLLLRSLEDNRLLNLWLTSVSEWAYLYIQFSGWTDIAIGVSLLMGIRLEENFNKPFMARNLIDFWQRWHVTLSSWCKDYIFTPILASLRQPFVAVLAAMVAMGLWHEVSVYYLLWGAYHATGIAICRIFQSLTEGTSIVIFQSPLWGILAWFLTINYVVMGSPVITVVESAIQSWAGA